MSLNDKILNLFGMAGDEDDEEMDLYQDEKPKRTAAPKAARETSRPALKAVEDSGRSPIKSIRRNSSNMEVCVIKPTSFDDSKEITDTLLTGRPVILNIEGLNMDVAQRIIDVCCGATYAIRGSLQKISNYIFILTPTNVDISGDLLNMLDSFQGAGTTGEKAF